MIKKFKPTQPPKMEIWGTHISNRSEKWKTYCTQKEAIDSLLWFQNIAYPSDPRVPSWEEYCNYRVIDENNSLWNYKNDEWTEIPIRQFRKKNESILLL